MQTRLVNNGKRQQLEKSSSTRANIQADQVNDRESKKQASTENERERLLKQVRPLVRRHIITHVYIEDDLEMDRGPLKWT